MRLRFSAEKEQKDYYSFMVIHFGMTGDADRLTETTFRWMGPLRMILVPLYIIARKRSGYARLKFIPEQEGTKHNYLTEGKVGQEVVIETGFGTMCACIVPWLVPTPPPSRGFQTNHHFCPIGWRTIYRLHQTLE